jgi:hypothetical protein
MEASLAASTGPATCTETLVCIRHHHDLYGITSPAYLDIFFAQVMNMYRMLHMANEDVGWPQRSTTAIVWTAARFLLWRGVREFSLLLAIA